jgi:hypothetical protein
VTPVSHSSKETQIESKISPKVLGPSLLYMQSNPLVGQDALAKVNVPPVTPVSMVDPAPSFSSDISQAVQELHELDRKKAMTIYNRHTKGGKYPHTAEMLNIIRDTITETKNALAEVTR